MKKLLLALVAPLLLTACDPGESRQVSTVEAIVSNVVLPDTVALGDTAVIKMTYSIMNGCGVYAGTDISRSGNNILIRPLVTYTLESNSPCTQSITNGDETVKFKPEAKGQYLLFFKKGSAAGYTADTLVVK